MTDQVETARAGALPLIKNLDDGTFVPYVELHGAGATVTLAEGIADGADVAQGALADAAVTAGATGSLSAKLRAISRDIGTVNTTAGATTDAAVSSDANGTLSAKLRGLVKIFADIWDSTCHVLGVSEAASFSNIQASAQIKSGAGRLIGIFVSAASSTPTIKVWDSLTASGTVLIGTFTPIAGTPYFFPAKFATGCYITISGTVDCTALYA